jgi:hypothetical protein
MMSPQANSQAAAYYAHTYGSGAYGHSPSRRGWRQPRVGNNFSVDRRTPNKVGDKPDTTQDVTPPPTVRKVTNHGADRVTSPATVETTAESESVVET